MQKVHRHATQEKDYIFELYEMIKRDFPISKIADWLAINGLRHSNQLVSRTFKIAGREDLIDIFIKEEDINVGDTIRSRMTARIGEVIEVGKDGGKLIVRWESGGKQPVGKESVFKIRNKDISSTADISIAKNIYDNYGDIKK